MHFSDNQKVLQENEQQKKELETLKATIKKQKEKESAIPPEIKELFQYLEENPLLKHQLLTHFYRHKKGKPAAEGIEMEETGESPFE